MALLEVERLNVVLGGRPVLEELTFSLARGQRLGIIGESGSGKTMAALAIMGLLPEGGTATGKITLDDIQVPEDETARAKIRGRRIGMVFQDPTTSLDPLQTAGTQVLEAMQLAGRTVDLRKEVEQLFKDVGLDVAHAARYPHQLSGGQQQRVMIAAALAGKPDILICDEPTSALDLIAQRRVLDLIDRLCRDHGMALILISHDLKAVASLCDRLLVLEDGRAVESGDKLEVFGRPKHDYTRLLMAAGRHRARTLMRTPIAGTLLDVRHVSKRYRDAGSTPWQRRPPIVAVDDVSFTIRAGESLAIVGPSGAGKSTLGRIIAGLDRVSSGDLEFAESIYHGPDLPRIARHQISLVFQDPFGSFNPRLTMGESLAEPLQLEAEHNVDELGRRIVEVVTAVGLSADMLTRHPHEFSGGQRQRFAIARALITRPRLIVLDEPVSALDVAMRGEVLVLLNRLRADYGLTFLVISHDLDMVRIVADRVLVMDKGRIVETGTPAQLLDNPKQPLTQELVAARLPDVGIVPV